MTGARAQHKRTRQPRPRESSVASALPEPTVRRLALYVRVSERLHSEGQQWVSSYELAELTHTGDAQVRRDLLIIGAKGTRGAGYALKTLIAALRTTLGRGEQRRVYVVGAGKVGLALSRYANLGHGAFRVIGLFDSDKHKIGVRYGDLVVRDAREVGRCAVREKPHLAVIATPAKHAQQVADSLVSSGIAGILNFAPVPLKVPSRVYVQNVDLLVELELVAFRVTHRQSLP